jgi:hypothetical protein
MTGFRPLNTVAAAELRGVAGEFILRDRWNTS